jgi:1,4-dihydroxy-6-naphthoate synthase
MTLTLGFSPCPNDTFIFDALVNKKIDTGGIDFEVSLEDVETLNRGAFESRLDITKLSYPAYFQNTNKYVLLNAGSAMGKGVGPILISKESPQSSVLSPQSTVALPGKNTTANMLFSFAYPDAKRKRFMVFSAIEDAVLNCETDLGVIIHENRFTYQQKGLHKVTDLGEFWEKKINMPIPLGGIAIKRSIDHDVIMKVNDLIRKSLEYAFANYPVITDYVKEHSQTMSEEVMRQHIELYVNDFTLDLGKEGKEAINTMYEVFKSIDRAAINDQQQLFL